MSTDVDNVVEQLGPREVIGQAVDLLIARHHVSRDAAFALLVRGSSRFQRKVCEIAADIVGQGEAE